MFQNQLKIRPCLLLPACLFAGSALLAGCSDPYSQNRIRHRMEGVNNTIGDMGKREASGTIRVREAGETFRKWWKSDTKRFNERMPTVGDYIW